MTMKRILLSIAATAMLLTAGAVSGLAQGMNVVTNGDFTSPLSGTWTTVPFGTNPIVDRTCPIQTPIANPSPLFSCRARILTFAASDGGEFSQSVTIPTSPTLGATYRLVFGYLNNSTTGMTVTAIISDGTTTISSDVALSISSTEKVVDVLIPSTFGSSATITLRMVNVDGGQKQVLFDNISLTRMQ